MRTRLIVLFCLVSLLKSGFSQSANDPVPITSVEIIDQNGTVQNVDWVCKSKNWKVKVVTPAYTESALKICYLEVQHGTNWYQLCTLSPSGSTNEFTWNQINPYIGDVTKFRTKKVLTNSSYAYKESTNSLNFLLDVKFTYASSVLTEAPDCPEAAGIVCISSYIEYTGTNRNLNITFSEPGNGFSVSTVGLAIRPNGYYVIKDPRLLEGHTYHVAIEYQAIACCAYETDITIPFAQPYEIYYEYQFEKTDNTGLPVQIKQIGQKGVVGIGTRGSTSNYLFLKSGDDIIAQKDLYLDYSANGRTYYSGHPGNLPLEFSKGTYSIFGTNSSGCKTNTLEITLNEPTPITFDLETSTITCNNSCIAGNTSDGTITVSNIRGGLGELSIYPWPNPNLSADGKYVISGLRYEQFYNVVVWDWYSNGISQKIEVPQNDTLTFAINSPSGPTLSCLSNGKVEVSNPSGGLGPYTFSSSFYDTAFHSETVISGFTSGSHPVYIKDANSCKTLQWVNIPSAPPALVISSEQVTPPDCYGDVGQYECTVSNVVGSLSVTGAGIAESQINIDGSKITITGLNGGPYNITITDTYDGNSCSMQITFTIPVINAIGIVPRVEPVRDKGTATGSIEIRATGGNNGVRTFYLYDEFNTLLDSIKSAENPVVFDNLAGAYEDGGKLYYIDIKDAKKCSYAKDHSVLFSTVVPEPQDKLDLVCTITDSVDCYGLNNADVSLSASGGWTQGYTYSQNRKDYQSSNVFNDFSEGYHTFYVADYYGGKDSVTVYFSQPAKLTANPDSTQNVLCHGTSAGWLRYKVSGGTYPYSFVQQQTSQTSFKGNDTLLTALNLAAGPWNFTVTDKNGCTTGNLSNNITEPDELTVPFNSVIHTSCEKENGILLAKAAGGTFPYTFRWRNLNGGLDTTIFHLTNADTSKVRNLKAGSYSLQVTDSNKCTVPVILMDINPYTNPSITNVQVTDVRCYKETNGTIQVTALGGTNTPAAYTLHANSSYYADTSETGGFDTLQSDSYVLYVFDTKGCRSNIPYSAKVNQPDSLHLDVDTIIPVLRKGTLSGAIGSNVYGGNIGLKDVKLLNSFGSCIDSSSQRNASLFFFPALKAGNYRITVKDFNGCNFSTDTLNVPEPENALSFRVTARQNALCKSQTGSITVLGSGGWGGYKYKRALYNAFYDWNSFDDLYAGCYLITVQDRIGATFSDTVVIYEPKDSLRSWVSNLVAPACANNGKLKIDITGGTAPYLIFNQTTGDSTPVAQPQSVNFTNLLAGGYLFNVTDSNGCHFDIEAELPDTNLLKIIRLDTEYPSGINTSDGAIKATVKGGNLPYTYQWKQRFGSVLPETSSTLRNIPSGHYLFNVLETGGCSDTAFLYLPGITDLGFTIVELEDETSYMVHDGHCTLTSVFSSWQNFELITPSNNQLQFNPADSTALFYCKNNTVFLRNLNGGEYFISGITSTGEKVYAEFRIEPYMRFYISDVDVTDVDTTGGSNGKIIVVVSGGRGDNNFTWERITGSDNVALTSENYPESSSLNNIPAGNYRVNITDLYNNSIWDTIAVREPAFPLTISIAAYKNESCKTYQDAYVIIQADGGWGDYQFRNDSSDYFQNGNMFPNLNVRKHDFYLTDKSGIIRGISVNITEPDYLTSRVVFVDSVNCKGAIDGNIEFNIAGGSAPYRFADITGKVRYWIQDTIARNIATGEYTYLFTDSNNCVGQDTLTVYMPEPDSLLFNKIDITHTTCSTDNGVIKIKMQGGTRPYRYEWFDSNNSLIGSDSAISNLAQNGHYNLQVSDWHNCQQHLEQLIKPSVKPIIAAVDTTPVLCYGDNTGTALVTQIIPGTPYAPCRFNWSNNDTGRIAHGFKEGIHFVTISDTNHCSTIKYFGITQPDSLWLIITDSKNALCYGYNDAFLKAAGRGGVGGYRYQWSTGDTTNLADDLYKGSYSVSITDANGCKNNRQYTITEPEKLLVNIGDDIKMCPGNSYTLDGKVFSTHKWYTDQGVISNERYVTVTEENDYFLEVTDSIGCFAWDTVKVAVGNDALKSDFLLTSQTGKGDTLRIFELSNMKLDSLRWSYDKNIFNQLENETELDYVLLLKSLQNGIYNIELYAYANGCMSKTTKQVEIIEDNSTPGENNILGYKDPLIISFTVSPNPNNGDFSASVKLREAADIDLILFTVTTGIKIDERSGYGQQEYSVDYSLSQLNSGVYLLILKAKNERKQIKIIIQQ